MNTRDTAVQVRGVRGVPKSNTVPVPVLPVFRTVWKIPIHGLPVLNPSSLRNPLQNM